MLKYAGMHSYIIIVYTKRYMIVLSVCVLDLLFLQVSNLHILKIHGSAGTGQEG